MAMRRSCSWSAVPRPIEPSSSVTATRRLRGDRATVMRLAFEADRDRAGMGVEPLGLAERDRGRAERRQRRGVASQHRRALHEVEHAEAGGETGRAGRRQHMVRAADVVADGFGRVGAEEDGAGVADAAGERVGRPRP